MSDELFNVVQFFKDGNYEYVRRNVTALQAADAVRHYTHSVAVRMGLIKSVIVTDVMDCTVFEWQDGKGIVFPTQKEIDETMDAIEKGTK